MTILDSLIYILFYLGPGIPQTLLISIIALLIGIGIGFVVAIGRVYGGREIRAIARGYERILRGIPILALILITYFVLGLFIPFFNQPLPAASFSLGIRSGAYQSEIFRSAIDTVSTGQMDAARSIGLTKGEAIRLIILPQALTVSLQGWSSEYAVVLKDSSFAYILGIAELMRRADYLRANPAIPVLWAYVLAAILYMCLTLPVSRALNWWATRKRKELGI